MSARPVVTGVEMRSAEERVIASGTSVDTLMERAGAAIALASQHFAGGADTLVLCGPGNNGGDGYVAARVLAAAGVEVRVAASGPPTTEAAARARGAWGGPISNLDDAGPAAVLIDALFGTDLKHGLELVVQTTLNRLSNRAASTIAVDMPSGVGCDDGAILSPIPSYDLTVALGALKPAHLLQPAAAAMGRLVVADIGVPVSSLAFELARPRLSAPGPRDHKYTRGLVAIVSGEMAGAARLAALGAARAGAGYVRLLGGEAHGTLLHAIVAQAAIAPDALCDTRIGALVVGPGLGRGAEGARLTRLALASGRPLVLDADALWHLDGRPIRVPAILTPHEAEFTRVFGKTAGDKLTRARRAAGECAAVVVLKGADTIVAAPDGRAAIASPAPADLATAGTGDVLAGLCGTMLAQMGDPFAAAQAAIWLHSQAALSLGGPFVADDLAAAIPRSVALCR